MRSTRIIAQNDPQERVQSQHRLQRNNNASSSQHERALAKIQNSRVAEMPQNLSKQRLTQNSSNILLQQNDQDFIKLDEIAFGQSRQKAQLHSSPNIMRVHSKPQHSASGPNVHIIMRQSNGSKIRGFTGYINRKNTHDYEPKKHDEQPMIAMSQQVSLPDRPSTRDPTIVSAWSTQSQHQPKQPKVKSIMVQHKNRSLDGIRNHSVGFDLRNTNPTPYADQPAKYVMSGTTGMVEDNGHQRSRSLARSNNSQQL